MDPLFAFPPALSADLLSRVLTHDPAFFDLAPSGIEKRKPADDPEPALLPPGQKRRESYPSPDHSASRKKQGRRPSKNDPDSKRKAQNRAAQRAFRERKENHVKELESRVAQLEAQNSSIGSENCLLKSQVDKLQVELRLLKGTPFTFECPLPSSAVPATQDISPRFLPTPAAPAPVRKGTQTTEYSSCDSLSSTHTSPETAATDTDFPTKIRSENAFCQRFSEACGNVNNPNPVMPNTADIFNDPLFASANLVFDDFDDQDLDNALIGEEESKINYLSCSSIWQKVTQLPGYEVVDIDQICEDLRSKVVCSAKGAVCPEFVVEDELNKINPFSRQR
ncbi:AP-1-like transcription factor [Neolecta irregularis DAH-3]|uniref:AP-1-like transcription factor n=1 Tax=Neolecta irregularis (strain DAH-3) TaxID=1198029 RepID=A0A1U7LSP4_NEOID|nr:AP-1-like transcription factor [Neolecta irregularis DAH-3]|eukprot:OLL25603.1 AP-1-like transcription factor [Neolecta irregularis DAH-3]